MADKKKKTEIEVKEPMPYIDTELFLIKLEGLIEESAGIAKNLGMGGRIKWPYKYAKGRCDAYIEMADSVLSGVFFKSEEGV